MNLRLISLAFVCLILFQGFQCRPSEEIPSKTDLDSMNTIKDAESLAEKVHDQVNKMREQENLSSLGWNNHLARIAVGHSKHMSDDDFFAHDSPDGRTPSDRAEEDGFDCVIELDRGRRLGIGENLYMSYTFSSSTTTIMNGEESISFDWKSEDQLAEEVVEGWMNSPGHRRNLLRPDFREQGIGIIINDDNQVYVTQNFC